MTSKPNILSESLITPALAAKMRVFFEGMDSSAQVKYKHLCCTLQQNNQKKAQALMSLRVKIDSMSRPQSMNTTRNKFMRLTGHQSVDRMKKHSVFDSFEENYLSEKMISDSLMKQYLEYQNSLQKLKNNIKGINSQIGSIRVKQPLYDKLNTIARFQKISSMYIVNRAENELKKVMRQKQQLTFIQADREHGQQKTKMDNINSRNAMEQKINNLKLKRISTRQQLKKLKNKSIVSQQEWDIISIIDCFQKILELFRSKEENYENIKLETCVKIGRPLKRSSVMSEEKVQEINKINNFEQSHKIKISSMLNIIESIFNALKASEEELNFKYQELLLIKDDKINDLQMLREKIDKMTVYVQDQQEEEANKRKLDYQTNQIECQMQFLKKKSKFWVEFTQFWRSLLIKISSIHRSLELPGDESKIKEQIESYFMKYDYHQNTGQGPANLLSAIIMDHFEGRVSKQILLTSLDTFMSDWKSSYYLMPDKIEDEIGRLPSAISAEQQLYSLLDHLVVESCQCFGLYIGHSTRLFVSCYHLLTARKPLFSIKRIKSTQKKYEKAVKQQSESRASENNIKEEMRTNRSIQMDDDQRSKGYCDKVLIELLKMAAVPIGEFSKKNASKRGCFY